MYASTFLTIPRSTNGRDCIYNVLSQPRAFILSHCNGRFIQKDAEAIWTTEENAHSNWCVFPLLTQPKELFLNLTIGSALLCSEVKLKSVHFINECRFWKGQLASCKQKHSQTWNILNSASERGILHCNGRFIQKDAEAIWTTEENAHSNWCVFPLLTQPKHVWVIYLSIIFTCYFQHNEALQCTFENHRHSNSGPPFSSFGPSRDYGMEKEWKHVVVTKHCKYNHVH
jgi:hypothetical protein